MISDFHFLQPFGLLMFPLLLIVGFWLTRGQLSRDHWASVCDPELLPLLEQQGSRRSNGLWLPLVIAALLLSVAVAQPVWKQQPEPVFKQGNAVVIALDLSASMYAKDLKPSRLERARFKIRDLLNQLPDAQVALVVYAADAFSVTPLTEDSDTILAQLPVMTPDIMPAQGSRADRALQLADELLTQAGISRGNILLVSDEVMPAQIAATATQLRSRGRQLSILAVGTEEGAPVQTDRGLLKDEQGRVVLARTLMDLMQEAASLGGGLAVSIRLDDGDITALINALQRSEQRPVETEQQLQRWVAEGPWLVLLALPFILPLFRRGILMPLLPAVLPVLLLLSGATPIAYAGSQDSRAPGFWQNLWQNRDQQASNLYRSGDKQAAANRFQDPRWKQRALYETGQYDAALNALPNPETAADWYNQGNILARQGKLEQALSAYDQALSRQPELDDARYNRQLVENLLKQQQEQQQRENANQALNQNGESQDSETGGNQSPESDSERSKGGSQQESDIENGANGGSSQNGLAQEMGEQDPAQAAQQQARNNAAGSQAGTENDSDNSGTGRENEEKREQLKQQIRQEIDQQLSQQEVGSSNEQSQEGIAENSIAASAQPSGQAPLDESAQAKQTLLNRVDDDPAELWRRKFIYQYRQRADQRAAEEKPW